jgi:hypothetical protein
MVAVDEKPMSGSETDRRRKRPMVNNVYKGMTPAGAIAVHILGKVIKRLPPLEAAEVWAKAIENDLTINSVRWLWRLRATHTV